MLYVTVWPAEGFEIYLVASREVDDRSDVGHGSLWWDILGVSEGDETGCRKRHWKPIAQILMGDGVYLSWDIGRREGEQM